MNIAFIIIYISIVAWVFPIFRQYRSNLFYFFLFLGICDPLSMLVSKFIHMQIENIAVIISPILFYTINIDRKKDFKITKTEIFVFILAYTLFILRTNPNIILLIIHTLIAIRAIFKIIIDLHLNQKVNLFQLVLAFYMITSVASLIIFLNGDYRGIVLFYTNLAFQILIAFFFSIFREDDQRLVFKVASIHTTD